VRGGGATAGDSTAEREFQPSAPLFTAAGLLLLLMVLMVVTETCCISTSQILSDKRPT
jgi:hypothetical protein